ncbi:MAG: hypothetical protein JWO36_1200 [Myxococcales bacterium]|nr:hypothetical protein [Myxococcales bacterium]
MVSWRVCIGFMGKSGFFCIFLVCFVASGTASAQPSGLADQIPDGPVPPQQPPLAPAQPPQQQPPPGTTHATFVSTTGLQWEVALDQTPACVTPCTLWVEPLRFVSLHSRERSAVRLDVGYMSGGDVMVAAKPLSTGAYATGITFVTLGGAALITGITLGAVGCSTSNGGMCTAGVITGLSGAFVTAGSIWLMTWAAPRASIGPARPYVASNSVGLAGAF